METPASVESHEGLEISEIFRHALAARDMLERVWDEQTAHHSVLPLTQGTAISRGQCGVSSVWLTRYLNLSGHTALVAEGVAVFGRSLMEGYVWVQTEVEGRSWVVDVASDQFGSPHGTKLHLGQYDKGSPVVYRTDELFDPYDVPRRKLMKRYELLEAKINRLPFWRKWQLQRPLPGEPGTADH